ncbi:hypothetical protein FNH22_09270 [Fulvivirga sp. M361]|nr:hypothetical protein FNH22_09270 [Fulvivirga sp. M361]
MSLIGVGFLLIFNIAVFSEANTPRWSVISSSWGMPYANMILISIAQAASVIFLATGLIKKDKKIDTNEVFFVRPVSNLDYVMGKALALFKLFFWLNVVLLCIPLIVNITSPNTAFNPWAFILYPLLTSFPSIVFTTGLAFLCVTLLRNQPVTIIFLLGLAAVQLIYFMGEYSDILDFMAFRFSMLASDIAGFIDVKFMLWQRAFYLVSGITFLFATAFFLDRLTNHKSIRITTGLISLLLLGVSSYIMFSLWNMRQAPLILRENMITVNGQWADKPNVDIVSNHISLEHTGKGISCTSVIQVKNNTVKPLSTVYFTLNPGLTIDAVTMDDRPVEFDRNLQIVSIQPVTGIQPDQTVNIIIKYHGSILEAVAHLEVDQERYEAVNEYFVFAPHKKYAFVQPDYLLLTKDVLWYPDTQIGYSRASPTRERTSFIDFKLDVKKNEVLVPISQGELNVKGNLYQFRPEYALPQISLAMGNYTKKEITVDSITYSVYHYPENDYFMPYVDQLSDTLSFLITDIVNEYEDGQKLNYPFRRLRFVETPLQFSAYNKIYESQQAFLQPEIVLWPEKGGDIWPFDLRRRLRDMNRQARKQNEVLSEKQKQANVFSNLIKKVFTKQAGDQWFFDGRNSDEPDYSLFANLYAYNSGILSENWPLLNSSISHYLQNDKQPQNDYSRNINGISFAEECNSLMRESSIAEILTGNTGFNKIHKSVSLKAEYLFSYLGQLLGEEELKQFLYAWISQHPHQLTTYIDFRQAFSENFGLDIDPIIQQVYQNKEQPSFEIEDIQKYEVLDGDRKRYQVLFNVKNSGENDGVIKVSFNAGNNSGQRAFFNLRADDENKTKIPGSLSLIKKGETKQIGFVLDQRPVKITINTLISRNIPSIITIPSGKFGLRENTGLFEGERVIEQRPDSRQYIVIVDNEDPGFTTFSPVKATYLRAFLDSRNPSDKKYYGHWHRSYSKWLPTTGSDFYGKSIRSAHFTRSGSGDKIATWSPALQEEGFYDLYVYMMGKNQNERRGHGQVSYHYTIHHGDGKDDISYNISNAEPGWNYLGSYYFLQSGGSITLTDECELRTVYADAIKWVKQ